MKSLNQNYLQKRNNFLYLLLLGFSFLIFIFINSNKLLMKFDPMVVNRYLKSQDILDINGDIKDRVMVSDEEIYIASGYLYANGAKPIDYNFQHPPFIKYLFGFSSKYFNLPLLPNIFFGGILLFEVYLLGKLAFKSDLVGFVASMALIFDPVFKETTNYALLDLGQMIFILGFIISTLYYKKHWIGQGVLLGLSFASKFYSPVIIFLGVIYMYKILTKQFSLKKEIAVLLVGFITFSLCYIKAFPFNIFFEQAKIIKFMLEHNHAVEWGGVISMFFGGYILWPILFFVNLYQLFCVRLSDVRVLAYILPTIYFILMCFQLPFTRYFILILPFLYLSFANLIYISYHKL